MDLHKHVRRDVRLVGVASGHIGTTDASRDGVFEVMLELSEPVDETWSAHFRDAMRAADAGDDSLCVDGSAIRVHSDAAELPELCAKAARCAAIASAAWNREHDAGLDDAAAVAHARDDMETAIRRVNKALQGDAPLRQEHGR